MGLSDIIRAGVATADAITQDLQPEVTYEKYLSTTGDGERLYEAPVQIPALVDWKQQAVRTLAGTTEISRAYVGFLRPVDIDENDRITLPDGTTGPILDLSGFVDKATGRGYFTEVWLG